jgi:hypothetical protein
MEYVFGIITFIAIWALASWADPTLPRLVIFTLAGFWASIVAMGLKE